jgi:hypothetical protein
MMANPFWQSRPSCPVLAVPPLVVLSLLSFPGWPVLAAFSWPSLFWLSVMTTLFWLSCSYCPVWLSCAVFSWQSFSVFSWQSCPVSCSGFPVLDVLFRLFCSGCLISAGLFCSGYPFAAILFWLSWFLHGILCGKPDGTSQIRDIGHQ